MYIWIKINLSSRRIHISILCTPVKLELLNHSAPLATRKPKTSEIITKFNVPNTPVTPLYWPRSCPTSLLKRHKGFLCLYELWASFPAKDTYTVPAMVPMPGFTVALLSGEFSLLACKSFQKIRYYNFRMNKQSLSCLKFNFPLQGTSRSISLKKLVWPFSSPTSKESPSPK